MPVPPALPTPTRTLGVSPPKPAASVVPESARARREQHRGVVVTATPRHSATLRGADTERETLMGLDGRPLSLPDLQPKASNLPAAPAAEPTATEPITLPPAAEPRTPSLSALPSPRAAMPTPAADGAGGSERSSQERVHFNVAEGALPPATALFNDPVGGDNDEAQPTLRPPSSESSATFRRHPAVWFVAGSACTLLVVLLASGVSDEAVSTATPPAVASAPPAEVDPVSATRIDGPAPPQSDGARASADRATDDQPVNTADSIELASEDAPEAAEPDTADDEANAAPSPARATRPRHRPQRSKSKTFIPKGL